MTVTDRKPEHGYPVVWDAETGAPTAWVDLLPPDDHGWATADGTRSGDCLPDCPCIVCDPAPWHDENV